MKPSPQQQAAISSLGNNVIVSASAGSGKTSVLVARLCKLVLEDRVPIDRLLAMTFTKDAAGEMKDRLRLSLEQATDMDPDYVSQQLAFLETADICTIDSFCLSVVQNYYYLDDTLTLTMVNQAASDAQQEDLFRQGYQQACQDMDPDALAHLLSYFTSMGKKEEDIRKSIQQLSDIANAKDNPQQWLQDIKQGQAQDEIDHWFHAYVRQKLQRLIELHQPIRTWHESLEKRTQVLEKIEDQWNEHGYQGLQKGMMAYYHAYQNFRKLNDGADKETYDIYKSEIKEIEEELNRFLYPHQTVQQDGLLMKPIYEAFCDLTSKTMDAYQELKRKHELLDFSDMSHYAYHLIDTYSIVKEELMNKYQYILVDEFQDTNELQESIIEAISQGNNVFRVGDVKQAIYGFRQARPDIMKRHLYEKDDQNIILDKNYRSNASIIHFNNDFYQRIMNTSGLEPQFGDDDIAQVGSDKQSDLPQYPFRFLYCEFNEWDGHYSTKKSKANKNRYDIIAQDIIKQHASKGVDYKDICILTRQRKEHEALKDVLQAYGIPVLAEINHGFYTNAAVQIVLSTLKALMNPYDDIALASALLSPIGNVEASDLAKVKTKRNTTLYQRIKDKPFMASWNELKSHRFQPLSQLVQSIFAHNNFYTDYTSMTDKTNLDALLEKASLYPYQSEVLHFIQDQELDSKKDKEAEAFPYGKDEDVVRIKTMHQSKGLQFPVVYLLGYEKGFSQKHPVLLDDALGIGFKTLGESKTVWRSSKEYCAIHYKQSLDAIYEEMRIFYVATTRAQKECIVVDAIADMSAYQEPLTLSVLTKHINYTDWILHTYHGENNDLIHFESHPLYERPEAEEAKSVKQPTLIYKGDIQCVETLTASSLKQKQTWKPFELKTNVATQRGTLFHEIMGQCSYPFQKQEVIDFANGYGYTMRETDLKQILALNENKVYAQWMKEVHQFECSYIISNDDAIIHGFMDLVIWLENETIILDYKTDTVSDEQQLIDLYHIQLETYKEALQACDDSKPIRTALYSFHLNKIIPLSDV